MKIARKQLRQIIKVELIREAGKKVGSADSRDHAYRQMKKAVVDGIRAGGSHGVEQGFERITGSFKNYYTEDAYRQAVTRMIKDIARMADGASGEALGFDSCESANKFVKAVGERIEIEKTVQFVTGRAEIKPESHALLDAVVCLMNNPQGDYLVNGMGNLRVEGHTDSVGGNDMNMRLSQARAKSVADYLVQAGLSASRVESVGFGETNPVADNSSADGRSLNRRVEFHLVRNKQ
tara:strand:+ start:61 stop:768 length:708 start_codon:yes stop_codon:yes gene_type:complete